MDTVFPAGTNVKVQKEGNTYTAPGIGDNTRGMVLLLSLLRTLNKYDIQTKDNILFIGTVGEEGLGDLRGVKHLFRDGGPKIDTFIGIDGGANERLIYGAVGSHRYRVTFKGPGGHSWGSFGMANPHHALGRAIANFSSKAPSVTQEGPKSSFSVGRIGGGTSINSIPFESWMEVDMRSGDQSRLDAVDAIFQQAMLDGLSEENATRKHGPELTVEVKQVGQRPAGLGDLDNALIRRGQAAMKYLGIEPALTVSSTDANIPISLGIPAMTLSRGGKSSKAHSPAESWEDKDSHIAIQVALLTVLAQAGMN
jgi:acetylornithine deacetylase/succinyl-diaminopimelate desuccinylase-like protein